MRIYLAVVCLSKFFPTRILYGRGEGVDAIGGTYYLVKNLGSRLKGQSPFTVHQDI